MPTLIGGFHIDTLRKGTKMGKSNNNKKNFEKDDFNEYDLMKDKEDYERSKKKASQPLKALNEKQEKYIKAIHGQQLVLGLGVAGSGKTFIPATIASDMYLNRKIERIVLSRPMEGPGRHIGTLPGDKNEKLYDWLIPLTSTVKSRLGPGRFDYGLNNEKIEFVALSQIRGRSFDDCFLIADEAQNIDIDTMKSLVTRIGNNSKVVLCGDLKQKDLKTDSGLGWLLYLVKKYNLPVPVVEFGIDECVRSKIVKMFLEIFDKEEEERSL